MLKKRFQLSMLAIGIGLSVAVPFGGAFAHEGEIDDFEVLDLEELLDVVFTASKHQQSIFWSPAAVTIFTRDDMRSSRDNTLPDLLRRVPGFDVYALKPAYQAVGARALTDDSNNLVPVLVDGQVQLDLELGGDL